MAHCSARRRMIKRLVSVLPGRVKVMVRSAIRALPAGSSLISRYEDDVWSVSCFIIEYPKCGRTWLRLMLGRAIALRFGLGDEVNLLEVEEMARKDIPRIRITHDGNPHFKKPSELKIDEKYYKNKKVVFLVRDPRDVMVSQYFQMTKREYQYGWQYHSDISSFIRDERYGVDTLLHFMHIWYENKSVLSDFLLVRYEDMKTDACKELERVIEFIGIEGIGKEIICDAVNFADFDNMKRMEREDSFNSGRLRPVDINDAESYKVRKGKVGGYVDYLSDEDIGYLNQKTKTILPDYFGYT